jgi:hypothetical protein
MVMNSIRSFGSVGVRQTTYLIVNYASFAPDKKLTETEFSVKFLNHAEVVEEDARHVPPVLASFLASLCVEELTVTAVLSDSNHEVWVAFQVVKRDDAETSDWVILGD